MLGVRHIVVLSVTATLCVLVPGASATGADETCQDVPATIVGSGEYAEDLIGTDGPDVIVTNGARSADGRDGDDLICITGEVREDHPVSARDGAGDDRIYNLSPTIPQPVFDAFKFTLEEGDDVFVGGPGEDDVETFGGADDIDTAGGAWDSVSVRNYRTSEPFGGHIDLGEDGGVALLQRLMTSDAVLDGGAGSSRLVLNWEFAGVWDLDAAGSVATLDGAPALHWTGFSDFLWANNAVRFQGTDQAEYLQGGEVLEADLSGGDDHLVLTHSEQAVPGRVNGGAGVDHLHASGYSAGGPWASNVLVDLAQETVTFNGDGATYSSSGFEAFKGTGPIRLTMVGTDGPDVFDANGCDVVLRGGGGDDTLIHGGDECRSTGAFYGGAGDDRLFGVSARIRLYGGDGDDVFTSAAAVRGWGGRGDDTFRGGRDADTAYGGPGADLLLGRKGQDHLNGGPGRDTARGGPARDACRAEVRTACEWR